MSVPKASRTSVVGVEDISRAILVVRGHKVLLDTELAALYGVSAKRFNEQVRTPELEVTVCDLKLGRP